MRLISKYRSLQIGDLWEQLNYSHVAQVVKFSVCINPGYLKPDYDGYRPHFISSLSVASTRA